MCAIGLSGLLSAWFGGVFGMSFPAVVAAALFGAAAAAMTGLALMSIAFGVTNGTGEMLSDGLVAALAFAGAAWWMIRTVRGDSRSTS